VLACGQAAARAALAAGGSASAVVGAARAADADARRLAQEVATVRTLPLTGWVGPEGQ
jgi:hypothetical protein